MNINITVSNSKDLAVITIESPDHELTTKHLSAILKSLSETIESPSGEVNAQDSISQDPNSYYKKYCGAV